MSSLIVFLSLFFVVYIAGNYYIGLRILEALSHVIPGGYVKIYWLVFVMIAFLPFAGRISGRYFPGFVSDAMTLVGYYWMAILYYSVLLWIVIDLFRWLVPHLGVGAIAVNGIVLSLVVITVGVLLVYGSWNARNPQIRHYDIAIDKQAGDLQRLHVVLVSDIHLGSIVDNRRLEGMVSRINQLNPDVVLIAGDIIDENVNYFAEQRMSDTFRKLTPRWGTYACFGNHDYMGGHAELVKDYLQEAQVMVLRDESFKINDVLYIVGRDDLSHQRMTGKPRANLATLLSTIDRRLPIIVLDHQPFHLEEGVEQEVDLQLSGHTHRGQFFPNNLITQSIFQDDWGYFRQEGFQAIVSSGFGTWGPPIRIGNTPEIVDITISFGKT